MRSSGENIRLAVHLSHVIAGVLLFAGMTAAEPAFAAPGSFTIGWSGPLTGNSAVLGIDSLSAVRQAVDEANSRANAACRFEVAAEDDRYETAAAITAYSKLTSVNHAAAIIASTFGGVVALAPRAERDKVLVLNPLDCDEDIASLPSFTVCAATQTESVAEAIANHAVRSPSVAMLYDESNPFMTIVERNIRASLAKHAGLHLFSEPFRGTDQGFASFLAKAKAKQVEAVIFLGHDQMGQAMAEGRKLGLHAQYYTVGTITSPGFQKLAGDAAEGALVAYWEAPDSSAKAAFTAAFEKRNGRKPILELATVPSYDAARIVISAAERAAGPGCTVDAAALRDAVTSTRHFPGVSGEISFDPDGAVRTIRERLYRFSKGTLIPLKELR